MKISIPPGRYVIAISGGIDSVVLLDLLQKKEELELVVAHFNHGIRSDSDQDEKLVKKIAADHHLTVEVGYGHMTKNTSEEQAREARYDFLELIKKKHGARAIITAHHQDDLIETAFINILRGTGPRGLTAIANNPNVLRPLIDIPKQKLVTYAKNHNLKWREDSTNDDTDYLRNRVRKNITPLLGNKERQKLIEELKYIKERRTQTDEIIATISQTVNNNGKIDRAKFALLSSEVGNELVMFWLREQGLKEFDRKTINRISNTLKTALPGTKHNVGGRLWLVTTTKTAYFTRSV